MSFECGPQEDTGQAHQKGSGQHICPTCVCGGCKGGGGWWEGLVLRGGAGGYDVPHQS